MNDAPSPKYIEQCRQALAEYARAGRMTLGDYLDQQRLQRIVSTYGTQEREP